MVSQRRRQSTQSKMQFRGSGNGSCSCSKATGQARRRLAFGPPVKLKQPQATGTAAQTTETLNFVDLLIATTTPGDEDVTSKRSSSISSASGNVNNNHHHQGPSPNTPSSIMSHRAPKPRLRAAILVSVLLASLGHCDTQASSKSLNQNNNKGQFLDALAAQVERQHQLGPSLKSFVQQRPSKFDSGQESRLIARLVSGGGNYEPAKQSSANSLPDPYLKLYQAHEEHIKSLPSTSSTSAKAVQGMHKIMLTHEMASSASGHKAQVSLSSSTATPRPEQHSVRSMLREPFRVAQMIAAPAQNTKTIASVLSLLAPLATNLSSLAVSGQQQFDLGRQQLSNLMRANGSWSSSSSSSKKSKASRTNDSGSGGKHSFGSNLVEAVHKQLVGPLLGLGQMRAPSGSANSNDHNQQSSAKIKSSTDLLDTSGAVALRAPANTNTASNQDKRDRRPSDDMSSAESSPSWSSLDGPSRGQTHSSRSTATGWLRRGANQLAQSYIQDSLRDLLTLSQLPILAGNPVSTAPSELEPGGKQWLAQRAAAQQARGNRTSQSLDDLLRYAYIFGSGVRRKRDPLKVLGGTVSSNSLVSASTDLIVRRPPSKAFLSQRQLLAGGAGQAVPSAAASSDYVADKVRPLASALANLSSLLMKNRNAKPRGVMWEMATDPTLAVTVFHLLERASVALPLGFLLMPFVKAVRTNPLHHIPIDLARILPARASHRSVDYEELAKRLDMMDKILSRALRPTHREASFLG